MIWGDERKREPHHFPKAGIASRHTIPLYGACLTRPLTESPSPAHRHIQCLPGYGYSCIYRMTRFMESARRSVISISPSAVALNTAKDPRTTWRYRRYMMIVAIPFENATANDITVMRVMMFMSLPPPRTSPLQRCSSARR